MKKKKKTVHETLSKLLPISIQRIVNDYLLNNNSRDREFYLFFLFFFLIFAPCTSTCRVLFFRSKLEQKEEGKEKHRLHTFVVWIKLEGSVYEYLFKKVQLVGPFSCRGREKNMGKAFRQTVEFSFYGSLSLSFTHTHTHTHTHRYTHLSRNSLLHSYRFPLLSSLFRFFHSLFFLARSILYIYIYIYLCSCTLSFFLFFFFFFALFTNVLACVSVQFSFRVCLSVYMYIFLRLNNVRYRHHTLSLSPIISRFYLK